MPPTRRQATGPAQSKYWCFTLNNPTVEPDVLIACLVENGATYVIWGVETAPTTGTPHWQGYVEFAGPKRAKQVTKMVSGWHIESRKGTQKQAIDYCKGLSAGKTPNAVVHEHGEPVEINQGHRSDIDRYTSVLKESGMRGLADQAPEAILKYPRGSLLLDSFIKRPKPVPKVYLIFGQPDCGKTQFFFDNRPEDDWWRMGVSDGLWFDGYYGEKWALIDDFDGRANKVTLRVLQEILDRYPVNVQVKGGFTQWTPEVILLTTNSHPRLWYDWTNRQKQYFSMYRRFTHVRWHKSMEEMVEIRREDKEQWEHFWEHFPGEPDVFNW